MITTLKLPKAGLRYWNNGTMGFLSSGGFYWSSSPDSSNAYRLRFADAGILPLDYNHRAY